MGKEAALLWGKQWEEANREPLNKLNQKNISYQLIRWGSVVEEEAYKQLKLNVDAVYSEDEGFKTIVDGLAKNHQHKAGSQAAIEYVLEESAGIASFGEGIMTYPAHELNGVVKYILNKLKCGPRFVGHMLIPCTSPYNPQANLAQATFKLFCALEQAGYKQEKDKLEFFSEALMLYPQTKESAELFLKQLTAYKKKLQ